MECLSQQIADVTVIRIKGRIDHKTARDFEDALKIYLDECGKGACKKILMDMSGVDFMTSAGLRVLMIAVKICDRKNGEISVAGLQPMIKEIFKISRFDTVLNVFPTVELALENISPTAAITYKSS
jgi:anti-anti-sigma factor